MKTGFLPNHFGPIIQDRHKFFFKNMLMMIYAVYYCARTPNEPHAPFQVGAIIPQP